MIMYFLLRYFDNWKFFLGRMFLGLIKMINSILVVTSFGLVHSSFPHALNCILLGLNEDVPTWGEMFSFNKNWFAFWTEWVYTILEFISGFISIITLGTQNLDLETAFLMYLWMKEQD